jgi:hypothetical protein
MEGGYFRTTRTGGAPGISTPAPGKPHTNRNRGQTATLRRYATGPDQDAAAGRENGDTSTS